MRNALHLLFLIVAWFTTLPGQGQCTFTSTEAGGNWNAPGTWVRSGPCGGNTVPTPSSVIVIEGPVTLNQDFTLSGSSGRLTINAGGSLSEDATARTLTLGQATGSSVSDRIVVNTGSGLEVSNLTIIKSTGTINGNFIVKCNLRIGNQGDLRFDQDALVSGNLQLDPGNPHLRGVGSVRVVGCVVGSNGALNGAVVSPLRVCVQRLATSCGTGTCSADVPPGNAANCLEVLPVELICFSAVYQAELGSIRLKWATASEHQNQYFAVERSTNGREFTEIGRVWGAGTTSVRHDYTWADSRPCGGLSYYRLRQVDLDGSVTFSGVISARSTRSGGEVSIWPSGVAGRFNCQAPATEAAQGQATLLTPAGRAVQSVRLDASGLGELDLTSLAPGIYLVRVTTAIGQTTTRISHLP